MGKLTARKAATAGPGKHEDGAGLRLVVSPAGRKKWVLRYTIDGRRREMGLGSFPDVSLAEARVLAAKYRKQAKSQYRSHQGPPGYLQPAHLHHLRRPVHPGTPARVAQHPPCTHLAA